MMINNYETILRTIFSPVHLNKKKNKLVPGAFRAPKGSNEVSVDRLDYTTINDCKIKAKSMESESRLYFGVAAASAGNIRSVRGVQVESSPLENNKCHADILYDFVLEAGEEASHEDLYKVRQIAKQFRLFLDPDSTSDTWNGEDVVYENL